MSSKNKYIQTFLTIMVLVTVILSSFQAPSAASAQGEQGDGIVRDYNAETGKVSMISGEDNEPIIILDAMESRMSSRQRADALVQTFAPEFGITDPASDLQIAEQDQPAENRVTTRYQQTYKDVPVIAGELIVNANDQGALSSMSGEVAQGLSLDTNPSITVEQAVEIAKQGMVKWHGGTPADYVHTESDLSIFDEKLLRPSIRPAELVWKIEMVSADQSQPIREFVVVNAQTGNIPMHFNQIDTAWHDAEVSAGINQPVRQEEPPVTPTEIPVIETPIPPTTQPTPTPMVPATEVVNDFSAQSGPYYVDIATGNDGNSCTSAAAPCQHIQETINKASSADTIYVASGTYLKSVNPSPNVLQIDKSLTLSGGWDSAFMAQSGVSIIDGANANNGILAITGAITVRNFIIQNSVSSDSGAIYIVGGNFILDNSTLKNNIATNRGAGIYMGGGTLSIINSTISGNGSAATTYGGGIYASGGTVSIQNSTIAYNVAKNGGGIARNTGTYTIKNIIVANNTATISSPDCNGTVATATYSIIENITGCTITTSSNNLNVDPQINSSLTDIMLVHALLSGSPAINAGTASGCPATDERGVLRPQGANCDIGAYEYALIGVADSVEVQSGSPQGAQLSSTFASPLVAMVKDENSMPVEGVTVTFTAPVSGASGVFTDTSSNVTTAVTNASGIAAASAFTANSIAGNYIVEATASGVPLAAGFQLQNFVSAPTTVSIHSGSIQSAQLNTAFTYPLKVLVKDQSASPMQGIIVTFTTPASGAGSVFNDTGTRVSTAVTDVNGIATSAAFTANNTPGAFTASATVTGVVNPALFQLTNIAASDPTFVKYEDLVVDDARGNIYGADKTGNKIDVIDMTSMSVINTFVLAAGAAPVSLDLSPDGNELAIAQSGFGRVKFVNLADGAITEMSAPLNGSAISSYDVIYGRAGLLYVLSNKGLHVINLTVNPHSEDTAQYVADSTNDKYGVISSDKNTLYYFVGSYDSGYSSLKKYNVSNGLTKPVLLASTHLYNTGGKHDLRLSLIDDNSLLITSGSVYNTSNLTPQAKNFQIQSPAVVLAGRDFYATLLNNPSGADTLFFHNEESSYKVSSLSTGVVGTPGAMAATSDGNILFVSSTGGMAKFNIGSTPPGTPIELPGSLHQYNDLAIDTVRGFVYGTDPSGRIDVYDLATSSLETSYLLPSGANPIGIDLSPDGSELAIALNGLEKILFIDPETGARIAEVTPQLDDSIYYTNLPYDVIYGRTGRLYSDGNPGSSGTDNLHVIDTNTHTWVTKSPYPLLLRTEAELAITSDNNYVFANQTFSPNNLYRFDVQTDIISRIQGPHGPVSAKKFTIAPNASKVFTTNGQVWDGILASQLGTFAGSPQNGLIEYIDRAQDMIALKIDGSSGDSVRFLNATDYSIISTLSFPGEKIHEMEASSDGQRLVLNVGSGIRVLNMDPLLPAITTILSGSNQSAPLQHQFSQPLSVRLENFLGQPLSGIVVTFTAPASGASGTFVDTSTNTSSAVTDSNGIATSATFVANDIGGSYAVLGSVPGGSGPASFQLTNGIQIETYSAENDMTLPGVFRCNLSMPLCTNGSDLHADKAQQFALGTYNLYLDQHGRNSIDDNNMAVISTVHYGYGYDNAFWNEEQMVYGDGSLFPLADDVVAHELTHGVTQYESNLFYYYQSGAINESFSDLWGEYYDQSNGTGTDTPAVKWLLGEDVEPGATGALRSMSNPPQFGDPDKMTSSLYITTDEDNGGVHYNSGINNKAVFLMVDGGTFNGKTVTGIGWDKTIAIYYEAQTNLLASGADYSDLYYALQQACADFSVSNYKGITPANCAQVKNAIDAVQMNSQPIPNFNVDALVCPAGVATTPSLNIFSDNFESGTAKWNLGSQWSLEDHYASSPTHMLYGDDSVASSTAILQMKNSVTLPAGTSYLYFKHAYAFEYYGGHYYDGAVLEYSINNGSTWTDAKALFSSGRNYNGTIYKSVYSTNSLQGRLGFVGDSHGYTSTQYKLTSLAGKNVKFRWVFATDEFFGYLGWVIDDVKIYTCVGSPAIPALVSPASNALVTDFTPLLNWSDVTTNMHHYQVQISTENTFANPLHDVNNLPTSQYTVPTDLNPTTTYYWRVRSLNALDETKGWTAVRSFRTALAPPEPTAPFTGTFLITNRTTFDWDDIPGVTGYTIQASTVTTFATLNINATVKVSTYITTVDLPVNKVVYWRVRSNGTNGPSAWSLVSTLNTANTPSVPAFVAPAENALSTVYTPKLDWANATMAAGAAFDHYHIQVASDAAFSAVVAETYISGITSSEYIVPVLTPNAKYYWRVRSFNSNGQYSSWTATRSFRTSILPPVLTAPAPGTSLITNRPTFDWENVAEATNYTIQASAVNTFASLSLNTTAVNSTYISTADLPANRTIYWRVRSNGTNGPSGWSPVFTLNTANVPSIPALVSPTENLLISTTLTPKLDWGHSTIPVGAVFDHYHVQVATDAAFSTIVTETDIPEVTTSEYTVPALNPNTKYYWRVRSFNTTGQYSSWSLVRTFRIAPLSPILTTPASGTPLLTNRPTFDWDDVAGVTNYTIQGSTSTTFAALSVNATVTSSAYVPTADLPANKMFYWRVRTNATNGSSAWSPVFTLTTANTPSIPALAAPTENLLILTTLTPKLDWGNSTVPALVIFDHYQVQVATDALFSTIVAESDISGIISSEYIVSALDPNTKYYWRVRSFNSVGQYSSWSLTRSFRIAILAPALITPNGPTGSLNLKPPFDWADVNGAGNYTIQVSKVSTFSSLLVNVTAATSSYTPTVNLPANTILYWRVRTNGANGPGNWSPATSFIIQ